MTHQYPAQLPPDRVQAIEDSVARYRHELIQAHVAAAAWPGQAEQHEADLVRLRGELDRARSALTTIRDNYGHVCLEFETCSHKGCRDSYAAWHVANEAVGQRAEG